MRFGDYFGFLVLLFLNFIALIYVTFKAPVFVFEFFIMLVLLLLSIIFMYGIYKEEEWSYFLGSAVFAIGLINTIYVYFSYVSYIVVFLIFVNALGFVIAVTKVRLFEDRKSDFLAMFKNIDLDKGPDKGIDKNPYPEYFPKRVSDRVSDSSRPSRPSRPSSATHFRDIDDFTKRLEDSEELFDGIPLLHKRETKIHTKIHPRRHLLPKYLAKYSRQHEPYFDIQQQKHKEQPEHPGHVEHSKTKHKRETQMAELRKIFSEISNEIDGIDASAKKLDLAAETAKQAKPIATATTALTALKSLEDLRKKNALPGVIEYYYDDDSDDLGDIPPLDVYDVNAIDERAPKQTPKHISKPALTPIPISKTDTAAEPIVKSVVDSAVKSAVKSSFQDISKTIAKTTANAAAGRYDKYGTIQVIQKPGKFVASEYGVKFHHPKCMIAKRISKSSQVWFSSYSHAKKQGYLPDRCIRRAKTARVLKLPLPALPNKFMASEYGIKFHHPKCETAKRISKESQVWFRTHRHAKKQGYLPCNCVGAR